MPLSIGSELKGRYKVINVIGKGGMGAVYLAEDWLYNENCALKEMLENFSDTSEKDDAIKRFQNEAQMLAKIRHKNIPQIIDYFIENNCYYLVMKYIEGKNLQELMADSKDGKFPVNQVIDWAIQICDVLSYLHENKPNPIVFRDVKPTNIMIEPSGNIMLVDFGIAKILQPKKAGTITGTPGFAAPEQYQGFAYPASDIYSLGATLHYLLTGRDPQKSDPFTFPHIENSHFSDLDGVIMKALSMKKEERFQSALEMKTALMGCRKTEINFKQRDLPESSINNETRIMLDKEPLLEPAINTERILEKLPAKKKKRFNKIAGIFIYSLLILCGFIIFYSLGNSYYKEKKIKDFTDKGKDYLKEKEYEKAIECYNDILTLDPNSVEACRGLGKVFIEQKKYDKALVVLQRAVDIDSNDEETFLNMAYLFIKKKDIFNTQIFFKKVLVINEDNIEAINGLGDCYFLQKNYEEAIEKYKRLLDFDSQSIPVRMKIAEVYKKKKDYKNAIKWFNMVLKIKDNSPEARLGIADIYVMGRKYEDAIEEYKKILKYNAYNIDAIAGIGDCYKKKKEYDKASTWFEKAIKIDNNSPKGHRGKADIYIAKNEKLPEAKKELDLAIKLDPNIAETHYSFGYYYVRKENFDKAINSYKKAIDLNPDKAYFYYDLGRVYAYLERYEEAIEEYEKSIDIDPLDPYVHYNLGRSYYKSDEFEKAIREYLIAIKIKPDYPIPYYGIGIIYLKIGKFQEAASYLSKFIELDPDNELRGEAEKGIMFARYYSH